MGKIDWQCFVSRHAYEQKTELTTLQSIKNFRPITRTVKRQLLGHNTSKTKHTQREQKIWKLCDLTGITHFWHIYIGWVNIISLFSLAICSFSTFQAIWVARGYWFQLFWIKWNKTNCAKNNSRKLTGFKSSLSSSIDQGLSKIPLKTWFSPSFFFLVYLEFPSS